MQLHVTAPVTLYFTIRALSYGNACEKARLLAQNVFIHRHDRIWEVTRAGLFTYSVLIFEGREAAA